jgi:hypothetical protein
VKQGGVEHFEDQVGECPGVSGDFLSEGFESHLGGGEDEESAEKDQV